QEKRGVGARRLGAGRGPRRMGRHKKFAGAIMADNLLSLATPAGGISLKAQKKKRLRARGECAPEPPMMRNTDATKFTAKICGGRFLQRHTKYRVHVTAA